MKRTIAYKLFIRESRGRYASVFCRAKAKTIYFLDKENRPAPKLAERGYFPLAFQKYDQAVFYLKTFVLPNRTIWPGGYKIEIWRVSGIKRALKPMLFRRELDEDLVFCECSQTWPEGSLMLDRIELKECLFSVRSDYKKGKRPILYLG